MQDMCRLALNGRLVDGCIETLKAAPLQVGVRERRAGHIMVSCVRFSLSHPTDLQSARRVRGYRRLCAVMSMNVQSLYNWQWIDQVQSSRRDEVLHTTMCNSLCHCAKLFFKKMVMPVAVREVLNCVQVKPWTLLARPPCFSLHAFCAPLCLLCSWSCLNWICRYLSVN